MRKVTLEDIDLITGDIIAEFRREKGRGPTYADYQDLVDRIMTVINHPDCEKFKASDRSFQEVSDELRKRN